MGTCKSCSKDQAPTNGNMDAPFDDGWARAVYAGQLPGIQFLHFEDPDVIETQVNSSGQRAIHVAVIKKDKKLLEYLLDHNADINSRARKTGNTALHEACINDDTPIITLLLQSGADPNLPNRNKELPSDLCTLTIRNQIFSSEKLKAIQAKKRKKDDDSKMRRISSLFFQGRSLTPSSQEVREESLSHSKSNTLLLPSADFAKSMGIELEEVAQFLEKIPDKKKIWDKFIDDKTPSITNEQDLSRLVLSLCVLALKAKKHQNVKTDDKKPVKDVVRRLKKQLSKGDQILLTKEDFIENFHTYLFEVAAQMKIA